MHGNQEQQDKTIPGYLQTTNTSFDDFMANDRLPLDDLRQMALLKHKIAESTTEKDLWNIYLKLGLGQWETPESRRTTATAIDRRYWPLEVKTAAAATSSSSSQSTQDRYEHSVHQRLDALTATVERDQMEYRERQKSGVHVTDETERAIEAFVQHYGMPLLRAQVNRGIALVEYEYEVDLLEREFRRLQPTEYQVSELRSLVRRAYRMLVQSNTANRLFDLKYAYLQSKQEAIEWRQRLLCNKPRADAHRRYVNRDERAMQEARTDAAAASIAEAEMNIHEGRQRFNREIRQVDADDNDEHRRLSGAMIDLIYRRFDAIQRHLERMGQARYDQHQRETRTTATMSFSPTLVMNTSSHPFTLEQWKMLRRGPTYVPLCQTHASAESVNASIEKQYTLLRHDLNILLAKNQVNTARAMFINKEIKDAYMQAFSNALPSSVQQRANREKELVDSIRRHLDEHQLILRRTADRKNVFYLGDRKEFEAQADAYMRAADAFELCETIDGVHGAQAKESMNKLVKSIHQRVEVILNSSTIHKQLSKKLCVDADKVELPYLYFLPDVSQVGSLLCVQHRFLRGVSLGKRCQSGALDGRSATQCHIAVGLPSPSVTATGRRSTCTLDHVSERLRFHAQTTALCGRTASSASTNDLCCDYTLEFLYHGVPREHAAGARRLSQRSLVRVCHREHLRPTDHRADVALSRKQSIPLRRPHLPLRERQSNDVPVDRDSGHDLCLSMAEITLATRIDARRAVRTVRLTHTHS